MSDKHGFWCRNFSRAVRVSRYGGTGFRGRGMRTAGISRTAIKVPRLKELLDNNKKEA